MRMPRKMADVTVRVQSTLKDQRQLPVSDDKRIYYLYSKRTRGRLKETTVQSASSHLQEGYARNPPGRHFQAHMFANNQYKFAKDLNKLTALCDSSSG